MRITCKHCGTQIVVDGNGLAAEASAAKPADASAAPTSYLVGFPDGSQQTHTISEIIALYRSAKLDEETVLWTDGMPDWLAPFDVPEIAEAMRQAGVARRVPLPLPDDAEDERTLVGRSPFDEDRTELTSAPRHELGSSATKPVTHTAAQPLAAKPAAARRAESRSGAVDLFGGVSHAGSEADASLDFGSPEEHEHKLTGARNESSVLFSLDALTKGDPSALGQRKARDKEREKEASEALFGDGAPDSLLNMSGGGFQALAAPDFTKPVTLAPEPQVRPSDPVEVPNSVGRKRGAPLWLVAVLGIAAAAGGAYFLMQRTGIGRSAPATAETTAAAPAAPSAAPPEPPASLAAPEAPLAAPEAPHAAPEAPSASASAAPPSAESVAQAITAAGSKPAPVAPAANIASPTPATPTQPNKPAEPAKPDDAPPAPPPAADGAPFDKSAAVSALGAAAANAASCKKPDGPTGSGKVSVTFAPSGRATMTNVGGAFAGTDVGGCVARLFRAAKVPAFSGDPVTVSKSFTIE